MNLEKLLLQGADVPGLEKKFGKDGEQLKAFMDDVFDAIKSNPNLVEVEAVITGVTSMLLTAVAGVKAFNPFNPSSYDVFKGMRAKADEIAIAGNFVRYKKLRNLS